MTLLFSGMGKSFAEAGMAILPLLAVLIILQINLLKVSKERMARMVMGFFLTWLGIALFLHGVHIGFLPVGQAVGLALGAQSRAFTIILVGVLLGFVSTYAEPAVRVLTYEVNKVTGGYIPEKVLLYTMSGGVAGAIGLSMARIIFGFPLWIVLLVGYTVAFILSWRSSEQFVAIAFDSGGVATGPMTVTFILALAIGVSSATAGSNPLVDGFGMISLVALAPILAVLVLGLLFDRKGKDIERECMLAAEGHRDHCKEGKS
jgi:hypothetical protein